MTSMRREIAQGLVQMLQGIQDPETGQPLCQYVKLGHLFDPSPYSDLWAEIVYLDGNSGPEGSGGNLIGWRIKDDPVFTITLGCIYDNDSTAAMLKSLHAQDVVLPVLHSHYQIPAPGNPDQPIATVYSMLENERNDTGRVARFPNGKAYYLWSCFAGVKQQYNIQIVSP